jgi:photosystem II stability/assembly factor-like uncharacterized protein
MKKLYLFTLFIIFSCATMAQKIVWDKLNSGTTTTHFYDVRFYNDSTGIVIGNDGTTNTILITADAGKNWQDVTSSTIDQLVFAGAYRDANTIYLVGNNGGLFESTDGGQNWSKKNTGTNVDFTDISIPSSNRVYISMKKWTLFQLQWDWLGS